MGGPGSLSLRDDQGDADLFTSVQLCLHSGPLVVGFSWLQRNPETAPNQQASCHMGPFTLSPAHLSLLPHMLSISAFPNAWTNHVLYLEWSPPLFFTYLLFVLQVQYCFNPPSAHFEIEWLPSCQNTLIFLPQNLPLHVVLFAFLVSSPEDPELHDIGNALPLCQLSG